MGATTLRRTLLTAAAGVMLAAMMAVAPAATNVAVLASARSVAGCFTGRRAFKYLVTRDADRPRGTGCPPYRVRRRASVPQSTTAATLSPTTAARGRRPYEVDPGNSLESVSCPTASFCIATDGVNGNVFAWNGSSWSSPDSIGYLFGGLFSVSCPTASFCAAVDGYGAVLTYNGSSWAYPVVIDPSDAGSGIVLTSVSCPTASFCAAVDNDGKAVTYNGSSWSSPDKIDRPRCI